jgi:hypothetical protein
VKMILIQDGSQNTNVDKPLRIIGDPYKVQVSSQGLLVGGQSSSSSSTKTGLVAKTPALRPALPVLPSCLPVVCRRISDLSFLIWKLGLLTAPTIRVVGTEWHKTPCPALQGLRGLG